MGTRRLWASGWLGLATALALATSAPDASAGQTCTSGPFVDGVDVADGQGPINWVSAAGAGIKFAYIKASQGTYDTDTEFASSWSGTKAAGVLRGAYHFLDPTISGVDQATFYLGIVGTLGSGDLPPMLDIECPSGNNEPNSDNCLGIGSSGDATGAAITTVMNDWLTTVKAKTGRTPIVYSFGSYFADDAIDTTGLQDYPLYIAYPTTTDCFDFPAPWTAAVLWQWSWTGTVAGITGQVDLDRFLGTSADLTAFIGGSTGFLDAGASMDAGTPCLVTATGEMGQCLLTSQCAAMPGYMATPDYCPGPSDVQCCTTMGKPDAGVADAGATSSGDAGAGQQGERDASSTATRDASSGGSPSPRDATAGDGSVGDSPGGFPTDGSNGCACKSARGNAPRGTHGAVAALFIAAVLVLRRRSLPSARGA